MGVLSTILKAIEPYEHMTAWLLFVDGKLLGVFAPRDKAVAHVAAYYSPGTVYELQGWTLNEPFVGKWLEHDTVPPRVTT